MVWNEIPRDDVEFNGLCGREYVTALVRESIGRNTRTTRIRRHRVYRRKDKRLVLVCLDLGRADSFVGVGRCTETIERTDTASKEISKSTGGRYSWWNIGATFFLFGTRLRQSVKDIYLTNRHVVRVYTKRHRNGGTTRCCTYP